MRVQGENWRNGGTTTLVSEQNLSYPCLAIELDDDGTVLYWVGDTQVSAEVYRDVVATQQAAYLRTVAEACDHINWDVLNRRIEE